MTGHRDDCPATGTKKPMVRKAADEDRIVSVLRQLIRTVKAQEARIKELERQLKK